MSRLYELLDQGVKTPKAHLAHAETMAEGRDPKSIAAQVGVIALVDSFFYIVSKDETAALTLGLIGALVIGGKALGSFAWEKYHNMRANQLQLERNQSHPQ